MRVGPHQADPGNVLNIALLAVTLPLPGPHQAAASASQHVCEELKEQLRVAKVAPCN